MARLADREFAFRPDPDLGEDQRGTGNCSGATSEGRSRFDMSRGHIRFASGTGCIGHFARSLRQCRRSVVIMIAIGFIGVTPSACVVERRSQSARSGPLPTSALDERVADAERTARLEGLANMLALDASGETLLHLVARSGRVDLAVRLLGLGCDVNVLNSVAYTPLDVVHQAGWDPTSPIATLLAEAGGRYYYFRN